MSGTLFIVATPIGNLEDLTLRAMRVLREVDLVVCEDTRVTRKLLTYLEIHPMVSSVHEHSHAHILEKVRMKLEEGKNVAYVCDAGTPGVNDPGGKLVATVAAVGIKVEPVPGPSALTAAISVCGFAMDEFAYEGFVPHKKGRETLFRKIAARATPTIFLESTHRIEKTLTQLREHLDPARAIFIGRELTKMHETLYRGTIDEVMRTLQATSMKGEFVVIVGP